MSLTTHPSVEQVIAKARRIAGMTADEFDYELRGGGGWVEINSALWALANGEPGQGMVALDLQAARAAEAFENAHDALVAYIASTAEMRFTGWSNASHGPIRRSDR